MDCELKVLIADDAASIRERLVEQIANLKSVVIVGQSEGVQQTVTLYRALRPDVIILDIQMPDGNGFDVLRLIGQEDGNPLVVILSNYAYPQYRRLAEQMGVRYFLDKSMEFHRVGEILKDFTTVIDRPIS